MSAILPPREGLPPADAEAVIAAVCAAFAVPRRDLVGKCRKARLVRARCLATWVLRHRPTRTGTQRSYPVIARQLGGADHSTIMHRERMAEVLARRDPDYAALLRRLARDAAAPGEPLPAAVLARIDCASEALREARARDRHAARVATMVEESRSRRGERVHDDDADARMRASGSLLLLEALKREGARVAA